MLHTLGFIDNVHCNFTIFSDCRTWLKNQDSPIQPGRLICEFFVLIFSKETSNKILEKNIAKKCCLLMLNLSNVTYSQAKPKEFCS